MDNKTPLREVFLESSRSSLHIAVPQLLAPSSVTSSLKVPGRQQSHTAGIVASIVNLITKSGFKANAPVRTESSMSMITLGQTYSDTEVVLNVIDPEYSDLCLYEATSGSSSRELGIFVEDSIRNILAYTPKEEVEATVTNFLESFIDEKESQDLLPAMVKTIIAAEEFQQQQASSSADGSKTVPTIDAYSEFVTNITAEAMGDLIEEYLKVPEKKCGAIRQLTRFQADLRRLYYEKACRMTQGTVKATVVEALLNEEAGKGCLIIRGNVPEKERLSDGDMLALCVAVKLGLHITTLSIHHQNISNFGLWHLVHVMRKQTWALKHLDLRGNSITAKGTEFLRELLMAATSLRSLVLAENKIGNAGGLQLVKGLQANKQLIHLDLASTDLTMESVVALIVALRNQTSVRYLDLSRPLLFSYQDEPMAHLGNTIKVNQALKEIHLQKFGIGDSGVKVLVQGLLHNSSLVFLDLSCNEIVWDGTQALALYLQTNKSLRGLNLHANRIEDPGAMELANALANHNRTLLKLVVTCNNIYSKGLCSLVKSLSQNQVLNQLYVWGNKLETSACIALAELLSSGRLHPTCVDFVPYVVDGVTYLAQSPQPPSKYGYGITSA